MTPGDEALSPTERALLEQFLEKVGAEWRPALVMRHGGGWPLMGPVEDESGLDGVRWAVGEEPPWT